MNYLIPEGYGNYVRECLLPIYTDHITVSAALRDSPKKYINCSSRAKLIWSWGRTQMRISLSFVVVANADQLIFICSSK